MKILKVGNSATTWITMLIPTQVWDWESIEKLTDLLKTHLQEQLTQAEVHLFSFEIEDLLEKKGKLELSGDEGSLLFEISEPVMFELL